MRVGVFFSSMLRASQTFPALKASSSCFSAPAAPFRLGEQPSCEL